MWIGIDFSGDHTKWRPNRTTSNVWFSTVHRINGCLTLTAIDRIQKLPGRGNKHPFYHLAEVLREGNYKAAAIDAPFSIPAQFVRDDHATLLDIVDDIHCHLRPFPEAAKFVNIVAGHHHPMNYLKPLRVTEEQWKNLGVNVRSTMWSGPRGGAAFTAVCLKLLKLSGRPIWPWADRITDGIIVEAFPAAQLQHWGLPYQGYSKTDDAHRWTRERIINYLAQRLVIREDDRQLLAGNADALDSVICAFAAIAVTENEIAHKPDISAQKEGWICIHKSFTSLQ